MSRTAGVRGSATPVRIRLERVVLIADQFIRAAECLRQRIGNASVGVVVDRGRPRRHHDGAVGNGMEQHSDES